MTRRSSVSVYGLLLLCAAAVYLVSDSPAALAAAVLFILLPGLSMGWNLFVRRFLTAQFSVQTFAEKDEEISASLHVRCGAFLVPCGRVTAQLSVYNRLTDTRRTLPLTLSPSGRAYAAVFHISSAYCGQMALSVDKLQLWDAFSVLPLTASLASSACCTVLPHTFSVELSAPAFTGACGEADTYLQKGGGSDYTEVYQLRDYVPGDNVRGMHWLLSAKRDTLIYRDPAKAVQRALLLYWDKTDTVPEGADALAEAFFSVAQALCEAGIPFTLAFTQNQIMRMEEISDMDALSSVLPLLLGGRDGDAVPDTARFGRTLWFTASDAIPDDPSVLPIVCWTEHQTVPRGILFTPQNVRETLYRLDWSYEG